MPPMSRMPYLVITYLGRYNPYMIADVTGAVTDSNLNIIDVEQNSLHGLSIMTLIAEILPGHPSAEHAQSCLEEKLNALPYNVQVEMIEADEVARVVGKNLQVFTIIGRDKVGILKAITNALANFRVSIERMHHLARGEFVALELWVDASELRDLSVLKDVIHKTCEDFGFDTIIQPESPFRQRRRLVVFDMDNTIIDGELIDELARAAQVGERVAEMTASAMAGKLEFKEALHKRVQLLKGLRIETLEEIAEGMRLNHGAQELCRTLKAMGFKLALISGGFSFFAKKLQQKLGFDYVYANELEIKDGRVTGKIKGRIIDREGKGQILREIAANEGLQLDEVVAVGDGANDDIMLKNAGFGIAFNAHEILQKVADGRLTHSNLLGLLYCFGATEQAVVRAREAAAEEAA